MSADTDPAATFNHVSLRGRLGAPAEFRELPSGDTLAMFRITVDRPPGDGAKVDSIECTSTRAKVCRSIGSAARGDLVEVTGCLRRRFWRTPTGPASRYAVEASSVRVTRTGRRGAASRVRTPVSA